MPDIKTAALPCGLRAPNRACAQAVWAYAQLLKTPAQTT